MKIAFVASDSTQAQQALQELKRHHADSPVAEADFVVALGGDGLVLKTLYAVMPHNKPVFALRCTSSVGFMCNDLGDATRLAQRLESAQRVALHPLRMEAQTIAGQKVSQLSINEVSVLRDSPQAARLRVLVDGIERLAHYSGDGLLVATPAGSTAYNHSCGGPIMPLDANTLVMTAICGYRPRRWSYAVLPQNVAIDIEVLETDKRPVRVETGQQTLHHVARVHIQLDRAASFTLLFDPDQHLGERIVREQFMT